MNIETSLFIYCFPLTIDVIHLIVIEGGNRMNINKFTQKSIEAVNQCEKIAYDYGNQEIDQEHFLYSLLTIEDSLSRA